MVYFPRSDFEMHNVLWSADEERDGVPVGRLGEDQRKNPRLTELQMEELLLAAPLSNRKRL